MPCTRGVVERRGVFEGVVDGDHLASRGLEHDRSGRVVVAGDRRGEADAGLREVNALFLIVCWRPKPSNMRPKLSARAAEVNAKITGLPRESQRALISSESMLTRVVVAELGLATERERAADRRWCGRDARARCTAHHVGAGRAGDCDGCGRGRGRRDARRGHGVGGGGDRADRDHGRRQGAEGACARIAFHGLDVFPVAWATFGCCGVGTGAA